ncbi:MAG: hypothetical protein FJY67_11805 [Calditrichaeota bacterium]|nr:hypothetical protein [Calditrichota bacterium]
MKTLPRATARATARAQRQPYSSGKTMARSNSLSCALLALLAIVCLFAAPSEAWATDLDFEMDIQWNDVDPYDVEAEVQLLNAAGQAVTEWKKMTPNAQATLYTLTIEGVPSSADTARFRWRNPDNREWGGMDIVGFPNADPVIAEPSLNWSGLTINDVFVQ